jgi:hypothetical protein
VRTTILAVALSLFQSGAAVFAGLSMRPAPNGAVTNHSFRTTGEKWRAHVQNAAELGLLPANL